MGEVVASARRDSPVAFRQQAQQLPLVLGRFVGFDADEHGGRAAALDNHDRLPGVVRALQRRGGVLPKIRDGRSPSASSGV